MTTKLLCGDARAVLRDLPARSARCCVTSPPYWGLRDYGTAQWEGGDSSCAHKGRPKPRQDTTGSGVNHGRFAATRGNQPAKSAYSVPVRGVCNCGARRIDQQIGIELSPSAYADNLVETFREVRRVLTDDGTVWLNLGDCYADGGRGRDIGSTLEGTRHNQRESRVATSRQSFKGLRPKNLIGIPWWIAFALQSDGWYLRADIIWEKPNPMPESVRDRPTRAHEYLFLLAKSERYFYDASALAEPAVSVGESKNGRVPRGWDTEPGAHGAIHRLGRSGNKERKFRGDHGGVEGGRAHQGFGVPWEGTTRNARSVWKITPQPYKGAHFATFPEELARRCILAGSAPGDTVLDPFGGSGTVGKVAKDHGRSSVLIELNPAYLDLARHRIGIDPEKAVPA